MTTKKKTSREEPTMSRRINRRAWLASRGPISPIDLTALKKIRVAHKDTIKTVQEGSNKSNGEETSIVHTDPSEIRPVSSPEIMFFFRVIGNGKELAAILKPHSSFGEVYAKFAEKCGLCRHCQTVDMRYKGRVLRPNDTPLSWKLDESMVYLLEATITGPDRCIKDDWSNFGSGENELPSKITLDSSPAVHSSIMSTGGDEFNDADADFPHAIGDSEVSSSDKEGHDDKEETSYEQETRGIDSTTPLRRILRRRSHSSSPSKVTSQSVSIRFHTRNQESYYTIKRSSDFRRTFQMFRREVDVGKTEGKFVYQPSDAGWSIGRAIIVTDKDTPDSIGMADKHDEIWFKIYLPEHGSYKAKERCQRLKLCEE